MSNIESPIFRKKIATQNNELKQYTVSDESDDEFEYVEDPRTRFQQARKEKESNNRLGEVSLKRIEILANIGRLTKEVNIDNIVFSLRTLKAKETKEVFISTISNVKTELELSYEIRRYQLAMSIYKIDGQEIELVLGSNELKDKLLFIDELEESIVNRLSDEFEKLKEQAKNKYSVKNDVEAKEVLEDLKK